MINIDISNTKNFSLNYIFFFIVWKIAIYDKDRLITISLEYNFIKTLKELFFIFYHSNGAQKNWIKKQNIECYILLKLWFFRCAL